MVRLNLSNLPSSGAELPAATGVVIVIFGLMQRSSAVDKFSLVPTFFLFIFLIAVFFFLFYRSLSSPPARQPLATGRDLDNMKTFLAFKSAPLLSFTRL